MAKTYHSFGMLAAAAAAAAGVLVAVGMLMLTILVMVEPAGAAFPGKNGKIAFESNRDGNYEIYTMNLTAQAWSASPTIPRKTLVPIGNLSR